MKRFSFVEWTLITVIVAFAVMVAVTIVFGKPTDFSAPRKQCEAAGGLFYPGGWGADNCVFPPESQS